MMLLAHCSKVKEDYIEKIIPYKKYMVKNFVGFGEIIAETGEVFRIEYTVQDHKIHGEWYLTRGYIENRT